MSDSTISFGANALDIGKKDGLGLNKRARLDNQKQIEQYSPRFELIINPSFPYRIIPLIPQQLLNVSSERISS
jgi:hypothetical protein